MPNNTDRIAEIKEVLGAGASSVQVDGVNITYDLAQLRNELRQLMQEDDEEQGRRPVASSIYLGGF